MTMSIGTILPEPPDTPRSLPIQFPRRPCYGLLLAAMLSVMAGCATTPDERGEPAQPAPGSAQALYESAGASLEAEEYSAAIRELQRLEVLHPDDRFAVQGRMELVYAYYKLGDPESAVAAAGRFIRDYPDHPNLDYLYYLRGLARFEQAMQELSETGAGSSERPASVGLALQYFNELIGRYPQSRYSADARNRVSHLQKKLAEHELAAAKRHLNRGEYTRAGLRARSVIEHYQDSGLATEAATVVNMASRMGNLEDDALNRALAEAQSQQTPPAAAPGDDADVKWHREAWIREQDPDAWTLQLLGTADEQALQSFIDRHGLEDAAYFQSSTIDRPWYSLVYGVFDNIDAARAAVERLPREALGERPWIRRIGEVQALISIEQGRSDDPETENDGQ